MDIRCLHAVRWLATLLGLGAALLLAADSGHGREPRELTAMINGFKADPRGPYSAIRWFCADGTTIPAASRCPTPGGIQHALLKPMVVRLAETEGIYWGQILAGTSGIDFLDEPRYFSRLKQYQLERYLQRVDDGWILRQARYYRGAVQVEDESRWGATFLKNVLADDRMVETQFFLLRQAARDIPHFADDDRWKAIRARSQSISEILPDFMPLRVKLHGQPEPADVAALKTFLVTHKGLSPDRQTEIEALIQDLDAAFRNGEKERLELFVSRLAREAPSRIRLVEILDTAADDGEPSRRVAHWRDLADFLVQLRLDIRRTAKPGRRLVLVDLSNTVEDLLFMQMNAWRPTTVGELLDKLDITAKGCAGAGYLEMWEWQRVAPAFTAGRETDLASLSAMADTGRRITEWGTAMVRAHYDGVVRRWQDFEPLAAGFVDDRVRSTLLLPLGESTARLQHLTASFGRPASRLMGLPDTSRIRGINPGYTLGPLTVHDRVDEHTAFSPADIVVLPHAPPDLKPVAGILTVSEGNLVSHVQLLARNLGIPNAILSAADLIALRPYSGQSVFYVVSPGGTVLMKPAGEMSTEEKSLVDKHRRSDQRIRVPLERIDLDRTTMVSLTELTAADSGRWCGPKAANLGQLKHDFPGHVVEGFAIPFGAFRQHMDQPMPGTDGSYWQFLQQTFAAGDGEESVLTRLARLRGAIAGMTFLPDFETAVRERFHALLGAAMDDLPVFVRSDTNMEDLKDFTGAGLNLTVFNVRGEANIFQAVREVWASVYTERSYRWRQHFLTNAENVYPSILILPTVDVAKSGVMITTGVSGGDAGDITVAFSRGAGGAVEGQMAESYRLQAGGGNMLLSPAREPLYTLLPAAGGTAKAVTSFETPLLNADELDQLRGMAATIRDHLGGGGPWDIELGFRKDRIWLFQVRPYVENKAAMARDYLNRLDPPPPENRSIPISWVLP